MFIYKKRSMFFYRQMDLLKNKIKAENLIKSARLIKFKITNIVYSFYVLSSRLIVKNIVIDDSLIKEVHFKKSGG